MIIKHCRVFGAVLGMSAILATTAQAQCNDQEIAVVQQVQTRALELMMAGQMDQLMQLLANSANLTAQLSPGCQAALNALQPPAGGMLPDTRRETICRGGVCCGPQGCF